MRERLPYVGRGACLSGRNIPSVGLKPFRVVR